MMGYYIILYHTISIVSFWNIVSHSLYSLNISLYLILLTTYGLSLYFSAFSLRLNAVYHGYINIITLSCIMTICAYAVHNQVLMMVWWSWSWPSWLWSQGCSQSTMMIFIISQVMVFNEMHYSTTMIIWSNSFFCCQATIKKNRYQGRNFWTVFSMDLGRDLTGSVSFQCCWHWGTCFFFPKFTQGVEACWKL